MRGRVDQLGVARLVQVEEGLEEVERGCGGEHGGVDVEAVVEELLLHGVRTHAVADQHQRDRRGRLRACCRSPSTSAAERRQLMSGLDWMWGTNLALVLYAS
jgi:hypothetical protein